MRGIAGSVLEQALCHESSDRVGGRIETPVQSPAVHGTAAGCRLQCVACSYPYASRISRASSNARPKIVMPAGNELLRDHPIGTVIAGMPVVGEKIWLLSPAGVLRSPISRGGLLHVG